MNINVSIIFVIYVIGVILDFLYEYFDIKRECLHGQNPKIEYIFIRALFFPITWLRKMWSYTKCD